MGKLYQELGLESLNIRKWLRRKCYFYKIVTTQRPLYLLNLITPKLNSFWHPNAYSVMRCRNDDFKNPVIPYVVRKWKKVSNKIRNSASCQQFTCYFKLLVTLRLGFSHLREQKFRQALAALSPKQLHIIFRAATISLPLVQHL